MNIYFYVDYVYKRRYIACILFFDSDNRNLKVIQNSLLKGLKFFIQKNIFFNKSKPI